MVIHIDLIHTDRCLVKVVVCWMRWEKISGKLLLKLNLSAVKSIINGQLENLRNCVQRQREHFLIPMQWDSYYRKHYLRTWNAIMQLLT